MNSPTTATEQPGVRSIGSGQRLDPRLAIVRAIFGVIPPFTLNRSRLFAMKACGIRIGRSTLFWGLPSLTGPGAIASRLTIGSYCGFNDGCRFELDAPVQIGDHVSVGHEVRFLTNTAPDGRPAPAAIRVGNGVWLGTRSVLLAGVTVGDGSVIGAGVTVSADVPPNTLMAGSKPVSLAKWR